MVKIKASIQKGIEKDFKNKNLNWAQDYLIAKTTSDNSLSCIKYLSLSKDNLFSLKYLAFIESLKSCNYSKTELESFWNTEEKNIPSWALEDYFETSFNLANKLKDLTRMAYFKAKLSQYQPHRQGKEKFLLQAIQWDKKSEYLEMLYKVSPRFSSSDSPKEMFSIGLDYERVRNFQKARTIYREIIEGRNYSFKEKVRAFNQLSLSFKKERKLDVFVEKIKEMASWLRKIPQNDDVKDALARNQIDLARAVWTEHRRGEGEKILNDLLSWYSKDGDYLAEAFWVLGMMSIEKKELSNALVFFEKGAKLKITDLELKDKVNWVIGWNYYLLKNYKNAISSFEKYEKITENFNLQLKMKFWKAISYRKIKYYTKSKKELREIIKINPYSYYGVLSHKELNLPFTPIKKTKELSSLTIPTFEWLYAMEEGRASKNFLKEYVNKLRNPAEIRDSLGLFFKINWYKEGINHFNRIEPQERFSLHKNQVQYIFPRPYENEIKECSEKFKIQDSLVYSIARQESGFDQYARSWADAFGLMQVTPEVAKKMSKQFNLKYRETNDLYDPKINIELGTAVIKDLINRFQNDFVMIVGSYNANYKSVATWKKERFNGDYLEFIELIPYEETQNFIKLVTRNYFVYKRLESNKNFLFPKDFFESI